MRIAWLLFGAAFLSNGAISADRSGEWHGAVKTLGENGGSLAQVSSLLGPATHIQNITVSGPSTYMTGPQPSSCSHVAAGARLVIWAYSVDSEGFYQVVFQDQRLVCLRDNVRKVSHIF